MQLGNTSTGKMNYGNDSKICRNQGCAAKHQLADMGCERNKRLVYDNGIVEIITPLMPHENSNRLIEGLWTILAKRSQSNFCASAGDGDDAIYPRKQENWTNSSNSRFPYLG
ncbi:hypothetical protein [Nostoc sp. 'Lobaria pulmonaria (5183) cyanobiont']|uniref:hypothetical protein n=1 Tax=Nostoc sp. 'Lobaria pulmonaria (5183) cyanobiont' TaxID=1618022 RepID=UPI003FA53306